MAVVCTEETLPKEARAAHSSHSLHSLHSVHSLYNHSKASLEDPLLRDVSSPFTEDPLLHNTSPPLTEERVTPPKSTSPLRESLLTRDAILLMVAYGRCSRAA